jgi:hypothetical protein
MRAPDYNPKSFGDIYETPLGKEIWEFLNTEIIWQRLELATELGHPAVEGIGDKLLEKFGEPLRQDRMKQAIGHMVRAIMEANGYILKSKGVKCRKKTELFVYASCYEKFGARAQ